MLVCLIVCFIYILSIQKGHLLDINITSNKTVLCNSSKCFSCNRNLVVKAQGSVSFYDFIKCTSVTDYAYMSSKTYSLIIFYKNHREMLLLEYFLLKLKSMKNVNHCEHFCKIVSQLPDFDKAIYMIYIRIFKIFLKRFLTFWVTSWHIARSYKFSLESWCSKIDQGIYQRTFWSLKIDSSVILEKCFCYFIYLW